MGRKFKEHLKRLLLSCGQGKALICHFHSVFNEEMLSPRQRLVEKVHVFVGFITFEKEKTEIYF